MKTFPIFWYESNAYFGIIENIKYLQKACNSQIDNKVFENKDEFLDGSKQSEYNYLDFGTRFEHTVDYTLRQFLIEHEVDLSKL